MSSYGRIDTHNSVMDDVNKTIIEKKEGQN